MKIKTRLNEIKSKRMLSLIIDCLYNDEHIIVNDGKLKMCISKCDNYIYSIVPSGAIKVVVTSEHSECDKDYPYAVLFYIDEAYGVAPVQSNFVDVIGKNLFNDLFDEVEVMKMNKFPNIEPYDIIEVFNNPEMRFVCNDECEVIIEKDRQVIHPDEDYEFELNKITKVWQEDEFGNYNLIWRKDDE